MPVKIENAGKDFYHVAFFTKQRIQAKEALTWDYGIDFQNRDPDFPSFVCNCRSIFCRNNGSQLQAKW
jgi:hypothetical protein